MAKQHKNMDRTSAGMARYLDQLREARAKKNKARKAYDRSSLSRGGFRS